jgi:uncharacterized protein
MLKAAAYMIALVMSLATAVSASGQAAPAPQSGGTAASHRHKVVVQISDNDPAKWNLALNNARNIQTDLGAGNVSIELVAYGPGINMIKMDSIVGERVHEAIASGVKVAACENTMRSAKLSKEDMLPALTYVPAGVVELMVRQEEGYAYIKP